VSLLEAVAMAGGYTRLGAPSKVSVRRVENGAPQIYHLDAGQLAQDPQLAARLANGLVENYLAPALVPQLPSSPKRPHMQY
jgi:protein involved in polysaccharide export with SLBB domain